MSSENPKHEAQIKRLEIEIEDRSFEYGEIGNSLDEAWNAAEEARMSLATANCEIEDLEEDRRTVSDEIDSLERQLDWLRANG